jgi:hypothetical protein
MASNTTGWNVIREMIDGSKPLSQASKQRRVALPTHLFLDTFVFALFCPKTGALFGNDA